MALENYCKNCGHRIHFNEPYCPECGCKTPYFNNKDTPVLEIPVHDIGFFDFDIDFSPMSDETMSWLDELLITCKRFHVDYYNASEKDRAFVEAVARKNYGLKQARNSGKPASTVAPFFGIHRAG